MDWSSLLNLFGATALVATFASLVHYRFAEDIRLWVAGYSFIVAHFVVQFVFGVNTPPWAETFHTASLIFAALFFIWAAIAKRPTWAGFRVVGIFCLVQFPYAALAAYDVRESAPYLATIAVNAALLACFHKHWWHNGRSRRVILTAAFAVVTSIVIVMKIDSDASDTLANVLCFDYLLAGALYARRFPRASAGVSVTVAGFIAWSLVFPVGSLLAVYLPKIVIDPTAWNIPKYIVGIGIIVTLLEEQIRLVNHLALHDALTGLPNRRFLDSLLVDVIARAERSGGEVGVVAIDLDGFKAINDSLGHDRGDDALRAVASRLLLLLPPDQTCARMGGDEFIVVVPDVHGRDEMQRVAAKVLAAFSDEFRIGGQVLTIGASVGTAMWPADAKDAAGLLALSDHWMYQMKRANRLSDIRTGT